MSELEALKAVAALGLLPHHVEHAVHQLGALCVVALGPVVAGAALAKDKVVWPESNNFNYTLDTYRCISDI